MAFGKTAEQKEMDRQAKEAQHQARDAEKQRRQAEADHQAFLASPVGQAQQAHERGDRVFQYQHDVESQAAVIVAMVGSKTTKRASDPSVILNAVCQMGWDLINGSFVFVQQGSQSRDKFMSSGQNVAVQGRVVGYYLFKRRD